MIFDQSTQAARQWSVKSAVRGMLSHLPFVKRRMWTEMLTAIVFIGGITLQEITEALEQERKGLAL